MPEQNNGAEENNSNPGHRITIQGARRMLGMISKNYEDEEFVNILYILYGIAEEAFEAYLGESDDSNADRQ